MKTLAAGAWLAVALCFGGECSAWNSVADFECAATNALDDFNILISTDFGNELTNYIAVAKDHESQIAAQLVLGERYLASFNETLNEGCLRSALGVASNVWELTRTEVDAWYSWYARLSLSTCLAQNGQVEQAYDVISNAVSDMGTRCVATENIISAALLKRNKVQDLSIGKSITLAKALLAARLKKKDEATILASTLPEKYREMVNRLLGNLP